MAILAVLAGLILSSLLLFGASEANPVMLIITTTLTLACSNGILAQFLLARQFGLINTFLATPLFVWLQPLILLLLCLFALIMLQGNREMVWLLTGAKAYGGFIPQLIFTSAPQQYTFGVYLQQAGQSDSGAYALAHLLTVVSCAMLGFVAA